jgi:hypothetical protein
MFLNLIKSKLNILIYFIIRIKKKGDSHFGKSVYHLVLVQKISGEITLSFTLPLKPHLYAIE